MLLWPLDGMKYLDSFSLTACEWGQYDQLSLLNPERQQNNHRFFKFISYFWQTWRCSPPEHAVHWAWALTYEEFCCSWLTVQDVGCPLMLLWSCKGMSWSPVSVHETQHPGSESPSRLKVACNHVCLSFQWEQSGLGDPAQCKLLWGWS